MFNLVVGISVTGLLIAIIGIIYAEYDVRKKGINKVMMDSAKKNLRKKSNARIKKLIKNYNRNTLFGVKENAEREVAA